MIRKKIMAETVISHNLPVNYKDQNNETPANTVYCADDDILRNQQIPYFFKDKRN